MKNCQTKFNMYLLYSTRPKNQSEQYSIHVDVYEKLSLAYRGSLLVPIPFNFLPIQRIAVLLSIPYITDSHKGCSNKKCIHGECIQYFNDPNNTTFCQCNEGWHGKDCSIPHICQCSANSLCIGFSSNNRSICICPINRWGSRCLLHDDICQQENITCQNGGKCIPMASTKNFECICPKEFFGEKCEIPSNKISLSFDKDLVLPETMLIHFIEVKQNNAPPEIGVTFKKISINRKPVIIFWPRIFHIVFVELFPKNYYLTYLENKYNQSTIIEKQLKSSDRCPYIGEIFNETFTKLHLIRRIKYFHVPCRNLQLSCFYDDAYLCLCMNFGNQRMANCIEFNHTLKHDCSQKNICKNGGQCLQDSTNCPQTVMCVCPTCFYGSQCQFSTNGYGLSLDAILGNHIQQYVNIKDQTIIVQISLILTVLMTFTGLMDGICSLITFKHKDIRKTGCGIYLLSSSITTLFTMILFFIKFHILLISQMIFLTNHSFLQFQCVTIDYFLRIGLNMDQWLNACVAYERTIIVIKEHNFDKKKSIKRAKFIIIILLILVISTNIIDPIHRNLIHTDVNDEKRIWCIITYSSIAEKFNIILNSFHCCVPFIINIISTIVIILKTARRRSTLQKDLPYKQHIIEQLKQFKRLFISSFLLFILALPRLIIMFAAGCMKTNADSWLFLIGYFLSFVPPKGEKADPGSPDPLNFLDPERSFWILWILRDPVDPVDPSGF
ncbi:unnamed protein product [Adineta steineri]|nr:unnamed protein product [Adineta steineri]